MDVGFVDVPSMVRWVSTIGAEKIIADLVNEIQSDFSRWPAFDKTPRIASHSADGVIELMPTSDNDTYGFKYVNGHPKNPDRGFQTVTAFGVLADVVNGYPTFLTEMTVLTALRTAAASAMAARHLARRDSSVMSMIGCGSQAEFQALGFRSELGIERLRIWDVDPAAMDKFERNARGLGFDVYRATGAEDVNEGADIITTCTADKACATVLADDAVREGVHINAIGGDCPGKTELDPAILQRATVFVEYTPQTRIEGEIQRQDPNFPVTELWEVVTGSRPGRTTDEEITIFDSVGFAIEDFSALRYLQRSVAATEFETPLNLVADPADPKDLFGFATAAQLSRA